jgi:hypothetical protein
MRVVVRSRVYRFRGIPTVSFLTSRKSRWFLHLNDLVVIFPFFPYDYIKMQYALLAIALTAPTVLAFPFVSQMPGVDSSLFAKRQQSGGSNPGGLLTCPNNPNHVPAPGITDQYPYNGAKNGAPGKGVGGYLVPAKGDTAHQFVAPGQNDIRGPCPGLNAAANHNFLAHDGITTFNELVDAQQNLYNVGYDLSVAMPLPEHLSIQF